MKIGLNLAALTAALILVGAGCQGGDEAKKPDAGSNQYQSATPTTTQATEPTNEFALHVVSTATGTVEASWVADNVVGDRIRVLHSTKATLEFPGAFWTQYITTTKEATIINIPSGERYFRLCEFSSKKNECTRYSEVVEVTIP